MRLPGALVHAVVCPRRSPSRCPSWTSLPCPTLPPVRWRTGACCCTASARCWWTMARTTWRSGARSRRRSRTKRCGCVRLCVSLCLCLCVSLAVCACYYCACCCCVCVFWGGGGRHLSDQQEQRASSLCRRLLARPPWCCLPCLAATACALTCVQAHQWTGDLVTLSDWNALWLNEGWATYLEAVVADAQAPGLGYLDNFFAETTSDGALCCGAACRDGLPRGRWC